MKRRSMKLWFRQGMMSMLLIAGTGTVALAQGPGAPLDQTPAQVMAPQQLDNLVAPIALYPDPLLGQVLVAATYPVELVEAQQWLQANNTLQGQQLTDAAREQNWDASVQALVAMPDVLAKLNQDIRWTTDLGNAFLAQQADVMAAVQRLRVRARANGKLQSNQQETVTMDNQSGQSAVVIQPADPQIIYVPSYDPSYVWGAPGWGSYPSLYYPSYGYYWGSGINMGAYFGGWGGWGFGVSDWGWGWAPNWYGRSIFVNNSFFNRYGYRYGYGFNGGFRGTTNWSHDPGHRLGVTYSNRQLNSQFGAASRNSRIAAGRSGNYHSFGQGNVGTRNSYQGGGQQNAGRNFQGGNGQQNGIRNNQGGQPSNGNWQRFGGQNGQSPAQQRNQVGGQPQRNQGGGQPQRYQAPATQQRNSYQAPAQQQQRYQGPAQQQQRYQAPAMQQRYQAPAQQQQRYSAPAQPRYQAPQQSAPRMSAPSGGGGARSFGGGGGSAPRSSGGGGGGGQRGGRR